MDEVDIAQAQELFARDEALFQVSKHPSISCTGYCRNCGDPVEKPRKFCDSSCTQDYEHRRRRIQLCGVSHLFDPEVNERADSHQSEEREDRGSSSEPGELDSQAPRRNF